MKTYKVIKSMTDLLDRFLNKLAEIQYKYPKQIAIIAIVITLILGSGLKNLSLNSDIRNEMPLDMPIFKLNDRLSDSFGGKDIVLIAVQIDESINSKDAVRDIRDPRVIDSLIFLDNELKNKETVTSVSSIANFFKRKDSYTKSEILKILNNNPQASQFISKDYKTTLVYVTADIGSDEEKIHKFNTLIQEQIDYTPKPTGVKFSITGPPILRMIISKLLKRDAIYTLAVSALIILILLFIMQKSFSKGLLIFIPLSIGLIWTMGTLGWLGIPLSIATVSLSTMILGLGVEYGVFVVSRYNEERGKKINKLESLKLTVKGIGKAITGSGLTTMVGFGMLSFATVPMVQHLGQTLALGIGYCLIAALFVNPVLILIEEDYREKNIKRKYKILKSMIEDVQDN